MDQFLEKIMNFINENTMLLILICIFLIVILVIYLIDNTIKSKRLEKEELKNSSISAKSTVLNSVPIQTVEQTPQPNVVEEPVVAPSTTEVPVEPVVAPSTTEVPVEPVVDTSIDDLLNKDYSINNDIVNNMKDEPPVIVEKPVVEPKNKYNNDKKLSDIFGKKKDDVPKNIETTQDFSDELDRILQKLDAEEAKLDNNSLEGTNDYTNMF